ncbi:radical SAM protein [Litoricolaceae bacterium]|nr:radical SAM protein [Litorivicinaceae bacterium]
MSSTGDRFKILDGDILFGSAKVVSSAGSVNDRLAYVEANFSQNAIFRSAVLPTPNSIDLKRREFAAYRRNWVQIPAKALESGNALPSAPPLCVDIEIAAVCDLACPHCFRANYATPDKVMADGLFYSLIDECAKLGVPSVKLNWRGEPLLHPRVIEFIRYAKDAGILDVIINTNATRLSGDVARGLIEAGLDFLIVSFDGTNAKSYEKNRPARVGENKFDDILSNIKGFMLKRREIGAAFPYVKVQMVDIDNSGDSHRDLFQLFGGIVDEIQVSPYSERVENGSGVSWWSNGVGLEMSDSSGNRLISVGRRGCYQPFQRLMVTYDGRVSKCCYDWGSANPVGYVGDRKPAQIDPAVLIASDRAIKNKKGFEKDVGKTVQDFQPIPEVRGLSDCWVGEPMNSFRKLQIDERLCGDNLCKKCDFKDSFKWVVKR